MMTIPYENHNMTLSNMTIIPPIKPPSTHSTGSHAVAYVIIPLGALVVVIVIALVIMMIFRKNRMERLRHHLMPLYNFDPQEEDWESELLDDRGRKMYSKESSNSNTPQLQFNT